ncbi:MAG TPA: hypothetical protein VH333_00045 [Pseudonocardiaceae bacterium]|nr:hypothetical protein [Pseudonocardiaceae bacterium]
MTTPSDPNEPNQGYQSGLPDFPSAPPPSDYGNQQPAQSFEAPQTIMASFWCFIGAAVIVLLGGLLTTGDKQAILDQLRTANTSNLSESQLESLAGTAVVIAVVATVIIAGLYVLFAFKVRAGRNWARIVLTIVAVLDLLALVTGQGGAAVGYIGALAAIVGCVLSYLPSSAAYFAAVKAARYRG